MLPGVRPFLRLLQDAMAAQLVAAAIKDVLNARGDVARMSVALTTMSQALRAAN